jgi:hypothetical protein
VSVSLQKLKYVRVQGNMNQISEAGQLLQELDTEKVFRTEWMNIEFQPGHLLSALRISIAFVQFFGSSLVLQVVKKFIVFYVNVRPRTGHEGPKGE